MTGRTNDQAVSVIVGTLLLILITVTAAAGLAVMISQMQKDEMNRQTHLNAVKNENITILNVAFENNQTEWDPLVHNSHYWSSIRLTLLNMNTDDVTVMGIAVNDRYALNFTDKSRTDPNWKSRTIFNTTNYLHIPATQSRDIYIDFVANASEDPQGFTDYQQAQNFDMGSLQNIKVVTSLTNFFEKNFKPPNPVYQMSIESESFGNTQRDVLLFDGSGSTADNSLTSWKWTIYDRSWGLDHYQSDGITIIPWTPADEADMTNWAVHNQTVTGKTVRISLNSTDPTLFSIPSPSGISYWGSLTVTDSNGMTSTSKLFPIPPDTQFSPPMRLQLEISSPPICIQDCPYFTYSNLSAPSPPPIILISRISATLRDINNNPVPNVPVVFVIDYPTTPLSCFSIDKMASVTDNSGIAIATIIQSNTVSPICPQPVTMHAQSGKLLSQTILIPGN